MDIQKIQRVLADATADLSYGNNKQKHLLLINAALKEIATYLDGNKHDSNNVAHTLPMIVGYMLYRMKEVASS